MKIKKKVLATAIVAMFSASLSAQNTGFEDGNITGWTSSTTTAVGTQTIQAGSNTWTINPYGSYMGQIQIQSGTYNQMATALGLTSTSTTAIQTMLTQQAQVSGGNPNPTTAGWITKEVTLTAGTQFTLAWQYISVDYVPFNDGSIATLTQSGTNTATVNNYNQQYALLGFTNPGTGDYSTGSYGATGWQVATFDVSVSGTYTLGFGVFNMGDTALSPILFIDEVQGTTLKNGQPFGAVAPNNSTAPSAPGSGGGGGGGAPAPTSNVASGETAGTGNLASAVTVNGGTIQVATTGITLTNTFTVGNNGMTIDQNGNTSTFNGVISGTGGVTIANTGSGGGVTFAAVNTYTGPTTINSGASLTNTGTIAGTVTNSGTFTNSGTAGNTTNSGTTTNTGTLGTVTNSGTFNNNAGGTTGNVTNNLGGTFTNAGTTGSVTNLGTYTNSGTGTTWTNGFNGDGNTATITNTGTLGNGTNYGTFDNSGTVGTVSNVGTFNNTGTTGAFSNIGILNNNAGGTISELAYNNHIVNNNSTITTITYNGGTVNNDGTIGSINNTEAHGTFNNNGTVSGTVTTNSTFNNNATGVVIGLYTNDGALTNAGTVNNWINNVAGTITNTGTMGNGINAGAMTNSASGVVGNIDNSGTLTNAGTTGDWINSGTISNTGTMGNGTNTGTYTNAGTVGDVANSGTMTNSGNTGTITNTGTLTQTGGTANVNNTGTFTLSGGTLGAYTQTAPGTTIMFYGTPFTVTGAAQLGGGLTINNSPTAYGKYSLLSADNVTGTYDSVTSAGANDYLKYSGTDVKLYVTPPAGATQSSIDAMSKNISNAANLQASAVTGSLGNDCSVFGKDGACVSVNVGGSKASTGDLYNGGVTVAKRINDNWRFGVFSSSAMNNPTIGSVSTNSDPVVGGFVTFVNDNFSIQASAASNKGTMNVTRQGPETGVGKSNVDNQAYQLRANYNIPINETVTVTPYVGVRHTESTYSGYTERGPEFPLTVNATSRKSTDALAGVSLSKQFNDKISGSFSVGVVQNLNRQDPVYAGTSEIGGLSTFNGSLPNNGKTNASFGAGMSYSIDKTTRVGVSVGVQQKGDNANINSIGVSLTRGF